MPAIPLILKWIYDNRKVVVEVILCLIAAFVLYWFFWHNPKVIKKLETQVVEAQRQVQIAHDAINLLGTIERRHDVITKISYRNISSIRYAPRPANTGLFVNGGVLQTVP